jgi:hypothetical protein
MLKQAADDTSTVEDDAVEEAEVTTLDKFCVWIKQYDRPAENRFRVWCKNLCEQPAFGVFFTTMIVLNTLVMAYDHYPMGEGTVNILDVVTFLLTLFFTLELIMRLLGYGLITYFSDNFNCFDFVIVVVSVMDLGLSPLPAFFLPPDHVASAQGNGSLSALRSFRLLRLLRLFRSQTLKIMLFKIASVVYSMQSFVMLLFLYLFILALIGMQFFANRFRFLEDGEPALPITSEAWVNAYDRPRSNFDDFTQAFVTIFQLVTVDDWNAVMYMCQRSLGPIAVRSDMSRWNLSIRPNVFFVETYLSLLFTSIFRAYSRSS